MLLHDKLEEDIFSFSERVIINYLIGNIDYLETMTTSSIAEDTHTNTTSIIRIAKKVNLSGWNALKDTLIRERDYLNANMHHLDVNRPFEPTDTPRTIVNKTAVVMKEAIEDTLYLMDYEEILRICQLIDKSKRLVIFSAINNLHLVNNFVSNLRRLHYDVHVSNTFDYPEFEAYNLNQNTVALFISYTGNNPDLMQQIKLAKQNQAKIVSITSLGENHLAEQSDYHLTISTQEKLYSKIASYNSTTSLLFLLNALYSLLFSFHYEAHFNRIKTMNHQLETRHLNAADLNEDSVRE